MWREAWGWTPGSERNSWRPALDTVVTVSPRTLRAFIHLAKEQGVDFSLLQEVEKINQRRVEIFLRKIRQAIWILRGKAIGILGLAFKPGTDDIREAVSLKIIKALLEEGSLLRLYDPQAMTNTERVFPETQASSPTVLRPMKRRAALTRCFLITEWDEFRQLDFARLRSLMEVPVLVDGRNLFTIRARCAKQGSNTFRSDATGRSAPRRAPSPETAFARGAPRST